MSQSCESVGDLVLQNFRLKAEIRRLLSRNLQTGISNQEEDAEADAEAAANANANANANAASTPSSAAAKSPRAAASSSSSSSSSTSSSSSSSASSPPASASIASLKAPFLSRAVSLTNDTGESCSLERCLTVVVIGASGDLSVKKTYPALFSIFSKGYFPKHVNVVGYARSTLEVGAFKDKISSKFPKGTDEKLKKEFLDRCHYVSGQYNSNDDFAKLDKFVRTLEGNKLGNRIFYLAIPPNVFVDVAKCVHEAASSNNGWLRLVVEKPFGRDLASSNSMNRELGLLFSEEQIYRIDHYLGKEMVQNLMILRFANRVYEPLLNKENVQAVVITFKEDFGTQGRGGYFDNYGIIRDVMQNHLLQVLSLVAMEAPVTLNAEDVRDEKVKLLRAIPPIKRSEIVIGQYRADPKGKEPSYLDDSGVPKDSVTPTFATAVLWVRNPRWLGVPFILKCGKALNERKADIRIQFKVPSNVLFPQEHVSQNELVLRIQPAEAVYLKMSLKKPGLETQIDHAELDLSYHHRFDNAKSLPDAYERLILDVYRGDHNLFVRSDELQAAWKIFTPILHELESQKVKPEPYEYGSRGPASSDALIEKVGYVRTTDYQWKQQQATPQSKM